MNKILNFSIGILLLSSSAYSVASNTSGVHGPGVKADDRSMQLRIALSPSDENGQQDNWAYRLHYQYAFNDEFRSRMILQYRDRGSVQYEYIRAELLYNFKKKLMMESGQAAYALIFVNAEVIVRRWLL